MEKEIALLLIACAREAYSLALLRYSVLELSPKAGDWVIEVSSLQRAFNPEVNPLDYFGVFLRRELHESDNYWVILTFDGREIKWGNADFVKILFPSYLINYMNVIKASIAFRQVVKEEIRPAGLESTTYG